MVQTWTTHSYSRRKETSAKLPLSSQVRRLLLSQINTEWINEEIGFLEPDFWFTNRRHMRFFLLCIFISARHFVVHDLTPPASHTSIMRRSTGINTTMSITRCRCTQNKWLLGVTTWGHYATAVGSRARTPSPAYLNALVFVNLVTEPTQHAATFLNT